jgi:hypothetical protein
MQPSPAAAAKLVTAETRTAVTGVGAVEYGLVNVRCGTGDLRVPSAFARPPRELRTAPVNPRDQCRVPLGAYPRRMGVQVLPATGRWDDFASFMVPRKPGGGGCVCMAYRNSSLDMAGRIAHMRALCASKTGLRGAGVRRWHDGRLVLGRAEVHLPRPGQLPDDPARPGRGCVVCSVLCGAAGVPAQRPYARVAGGRGRASACDGRDHAGRLPGRPWQRARRPDQRLRGYHPALRGARIQPRLPDRRTTRWQAPLARAPRASLTSLAACSPAQE